MSKKVPFYKSRLGLFFQGVCVVAVFIIAIAAVVQLKHTKPAKKLWVQHNYGGGSMQMHYAPPYGPLCQGCTKGSYTFIELSEK